MAEKSHQFKTRISFERPIFLEVDGDKWQGSLAINLFVWGTVSFQNISPPRKFILWGRQDDMFH